MWLEGTIGVKNADGRYTGVHYCCKRFDEPSKDMALPEAESPSWY